MAREILFKAKRRDTGEWVEGFLFQIYSDSDSNWCIGNEALYPNDYGEIIGEGSSWFFIDKDTLCQYTGLLDKNGNKIWENDVVKYHFGEDVAPIRFGKYQGCFDSTKTAHIGFYVDWNDKTCLRKDLGYWVNMIDYNVIGNIFDNPELLEMGCE